MASSDSSSFGSEDVAGHVPFDSLGVEQSPRASTQFSYAFVRIVCFYWFAPQKDVVLKQGPFNTETQEGRILKGVRKSLCVRRGKGSRKNPARAGW